MMKTTWYNTYVYSIIFISLLFLAGNLFAANSDTMPNVANMSSKPTHSTHSSASLKKTTSGATSLSNSSDTSSSSSITTTGSSAHSASDSDAVSSNTSADSSTDASVELPIDTTDTYQPPKDPLQPFNRAMFKFNNFFDDFILKPISEVYASIVPKPLAKGISNVFSNLDMVPTVLNDLMMFNLYQATSDVWRLGVNTTLGIGGLFDVASQIGLEPNTEDFGLTLARWGWINSTYIVIPFMGPSTLRDGVVGSPVNYYFLSVYPYIKPRSIQYGTYGLWVISRRAELLHYQEVMDSVMIDKYIFMRDAYLQRRNYLIERNKELNNPYLANNSLENDNAIKKEQHAIIATKPFSSI